MKSPILASHLLLSLSLSLSLVFTSCKDEYIDPNSFKSCDAIVEGWEITADSFPRMQLQRDIYFLNEQVGYAVGNSATITKTTDAGRSWQRLHYRYDNGYNEEAITDVIFNTVWFVNESVGYVGGERESDFQHEEYSDAVLLKTIDGGLTWTKIYVPETKEIYDIAFFDELTGIGIFRLTNPGSNYAFQIRRTTNGGFTWSGDVLPLNRLYHYKFYHSPSKVMCINDNGSEHPVLLSTTDKGLTWQSVTLPQTHYADLYFIDDLDVIGNFAYQEFERSLYKSADGGITWEEFETPFAAKELMHFSSLQEGFILNGLYEWESGGGESWQVLRGTEIYQTSNGGQSWERSEYGTACYIEGIPFALERDVFYVLNNSQLKRIIK